MKRILLFFLTLVLLSALAYADEHGKHSKKEPRDKRNSVVRHCEEACKSYGYMKDQLTRCVELCQQCIIDAGNQPNW